MKFPTIGGIASLLLGGDNETAPILRSADKKTGDLTRASPAFCGFSFSSSAFALVILLTSRSVDLHI